ncbi:hypothetical protein TNCV_2345161, partial [Trichonephila clavipes]
KYPLHVPDHYVEALVEFRATCVKDYTLKKNTADDPQPLV